MLLKVAISGWALNCPDRQPTYVQRHPASHFTRRLKASSRASSRDNFLKFFLLIEEYFFPFSFLTGLGNFNCGDEALPFTSSARSKPQLGQLLLKRRPTSSLISRSSLLRLPSRPSFLLLPRPSHLRRRDRVPPELRNILENT